MKKLIAIFNKNSISNRFGLSWNYFFFSFESKRGEKKGGRKVAKVSRLQSRNLSERGIRWFSSRSTKHSNYPRDKTLYWLTRAGQQRTEPQMEIFETGKFASGTYSRAPRWNWIVWRLFGRQRTTRRSRGVSHSVQQATSRDERELLICASATG